MLIRSLGTPSVTNQPDYIFSSKKVGKRLNGKEHCKKCDFLIASLQLFRKVGSWEGIAVLIQKHNRPIWH